VNIHVLYTSALNGGKWSNSYLATFCMEEAHLVSTRQQTGLASISIKSACIHGVGGKKKKEKKRKERKKERKERKEKENLDVAGSRTQLIQPRASYFTDYTTMTRL